MKIPPFYFAVLISFGCWLISTIASAQVPQLINFQGRVTVGTVNFDGVAQFKFAFVNADGTTAYWTNDGTHLDGSEPDASVTRTVTKGLYSVLLGDATLANMQIVPATVFANPDVHLRVWFNDGQNGFQLLTPDQRIAAVGYAIMAATAQTVSNGAITSTKIADEAVTGPKIALGAVDNTKLANASITIDAGTGLLGGGTAALGGAISLANAGVLSLQGGGGITVSSATGAITLGSTATDTNTPETTVARNAAGGFSAGTISANLNGNAATATIALSALTTANFSAALLGDVTGNQDATIVASLGGLPAASIAAGVILANAATPANTPGALVLRDPSGNFSGGTISANLNGNAATATIALSALTTPNFSGALLGEVTGNQGATIVAALGGIPAASIAAGAILANAATPANTPGALVLRDPTGGFSGGIITATEFVGGGAGLTGVAGTLRWQSVTGETQLAVANTGYLATSASLVTITLPPVVNAGEIVRVSGGGAGGWAIAPNTGQSVAGFGAGLGPSGSQGATGAVQYIGNDTWQPMNESQLALGSVGSAQLAPNITIGGTLAAANFVGNGQGLTDLSAASLSSGTLADTLLSANVPRINAATNTFTGTLKSSGIFDATTANVLGFDKISLSGTNLWTGPQTFRDIVVESATPNIIFRNSTTVGAYGLGLSTDFTDSGHDFFVMGINMKAISNGYASILNLESSWGIILERDYFNGETFQQEAYFTDGGSARPFVLGYSQASTANVVSIVNGEVTISEAQVNEYLIPGLRFKFTVLNGASNVSTETFYRVDTVVSPTKFTFRPRFGGAPINATASGGTMKRGGWGSAGFTVPTNVITNDYDSGDPADHTAFQVANTKPGIATLVRIDNYAGTQSVLQINEKWRLGTDFSGTNPGNFYLMNLNGGLNDAVIQVDSVSRVAIGYKNSEDGYTPHVNTGTLDVNGVIAATRPALPATVVEGGFIVVAGTAYIGSGGIWRALSFAP